MSSNILFMYKPLLKRGAKETMGTVKLINRKYTGNAMAKNEKDKQTKYIKQETT